nr:hypothetical protein Iba_chr06eCG9380 [Ipomoea batatas]GME17742.1 hypothetical protein Iba_scaffold19388CG0020 [Ipomoea batatas]
MLLTLCFGFGVDFWIPFDLINDLRVDVRKLEIQHGYHLRIGPSRDAPGLAINEGLDVVDDYFSTANLALYDELGVASKCSSTKNLTFYDEIAIADDYSSVDEDCSSITTLKLPNRQKEREKPCCKERTKRHGWKIEKDTEKP